MRFPSHGGGQSLLQLAGAALLGLLAGALVGLPGWGLAAGVLGWVALQVRDALRLGDWLSDRHHEAALGGIWEDLQAEVSRRRRRARRRRDRLMRRLRRFQQITEALPDAVILCTPRGEIQWFNGGAQQLANLAATDVGNNLASLLRHPEVSALFQPDVTEGLVELDSPFANNVHLELRMFPDATGNRVVLLRDTTDMRRLLTMRQDFVANISHELRTPLTVIVGYLETLDDAPLDVDADVPALVGRLQSPVQRMKALVDDLLLLSRLEGAQPEPLGDEPPVDVPALLRQVLADAESLSGGRHAFATDIDNDVLLDGVGSEVHSALDNLVTNAVRYSPDGGTISISWGVDADGGPQLVVEDEGVGIAPAHLNRLTERFYRVDLGRSRNRGGTGLGLAIVKHVLRRHESQLDIDSTLGRGSTFRCRFPSRRLRSRRPDNVTPIAVPAAPAPDQRATGPQPPSTLSDQP